MGAASAVCSGTGAGCSAAGLVAEEEAEGAEEPEAEPELSTAGPAGLAAAGLCAVAEVGCAAQGYPYCRHRAQISTPATIRITRARYKRQWLEWGSSSSSSR